VQLARAAPRPPELPSSCLAALLGEQSLSYPYVGLSERDAFLAGCFYQLLAHPVVEPGIGGKADVLLLDGGVYFETRLSWLGFMIRSRKPAWIVSLSSSSAPASLMRLRQRLMLDGSIGIS